MKPGSRTPWGKADHVAQVAEGIQLVSTPSHGGYKLDKKRNAMVAEPLRLDDGWYEEDCKWAIVALTFPALFNEVRRDMATRSLKNHYPTEYTQATGRPVALAESRALRQAAFETENSDRFVTRAAWGDNHPKVPTGFVGVFAINAAREERWVLVPTTEYDKTHSEFGFVIDEARHQVWIDHA